DADDEQRPELRKKTRAALQRLVRGGMYCAIVTRDKHQLAAVQVWFDDKRHRDYLLCYRPTWTNGKARREGGWAALSVADVPAAGGLDLRKPAHVERLEKALLKLDLAGLDVTG